MLLSACEPVITSIPVFIYDMNDAYMTEFEAKIRANAVGHFAIFFRPRTAAHKIMGPGMDLVEVAPVYDPTGMTSILAAQLLLNSIGFIFHERGKVRAAAASETTPA